MIQVNLLPDVKQNFIKARRLKRLTVLIAIIVAGSALALFSLLFITVNIWQKQRIKGITNNINRLSTELKSIPDLDRVLTVQQQLKSLPDLHAKKPAATRLFTYISQVTPATVKISSFAVNFETKTFSISGSADKLESINKFVDTLKFTNYKMSPDATEEKPAFSGVVLKSFGRDSKGANYSVDLSFDSVIFDSKIAALSLIVPKIITTRSETERPQALFQAADPNVLTKPGAQ